MGQYSPPFPRRRELYKGIRARTDNHSLDGDSNWQDSTGHCSPDGGGFIHAGVDHCFPDRGNFILTKTRRDGHMCFH